MALTIEQIQAMITNNADPRQIINELADYIQANPGGGSGGGGLANEGLSVLDGVVQLGQNGDEELDPDLFIKSARWIVLSSAPLTLGDLFITTEDEAGGFGFSSEPDGTAEFELVVGEAEFTIRNNRGDLGHDPEYSFVIDSNTPTGKAFIEDGRAAAEGFVYAADYSATFIDRSLVDKAYVDTAIAAAIAALNP